MSDAIGSGRLAGPERGAARCLADGRELPHLPERGITHRFDAPFGLEFL